MDMSGAGGSMLHNRLPVLKSNPCVACVSRMFDPAIKCFGLIILSFVGETSTKTKQYNQQRVIIQTTSEQPPVETFLKWIVSFRLNRVIVPDCLVECGLSL